jgi:hypothetical protein
MVVGILASDAATAFADDNAKLRLVINAVADAMRMDNSWPGPTTLSGALVKTIGALGTASAFDAALESKPLDVNSCAWSR